MSLSTILIFSVLATAVVVLVFIVYLSPLLGGRSETTKGSGKKISDLEKGLEKIALSKEERLAIAKQLAVHFKEEEEQVRLKTEKRLEQIYAARLEEKEILLQKTKEEARIMTQKFYSATKKYETTLKKKQETESIVRSVAEGLVVVDNEGKILLMNPAAEKIVGKKSSELTGKLLSEYQGETQLVSMTRQNSKTGQREIVLASQSDSTKKVIRSSSAVIENEEGQTVGMVSVLTDVSRQKEIEEVKKNFINNITHDLRAPLGIIKYAVSMVLEEGAGQLTENHKHLLKMAQRNEENLRELVNNLLDTAKLEAGKMRLKPQEVNLADLIGTVLDDLSPWALAKKISLEKPYQTTDVVFIDPKLIRQVLTNLVGNAIKFTPEGGTIQVEIVKKEERLDVRVTDNGIGIVQKDLPFVFDKFHQGGERASSDITGTGLGLAIAKEIVKLHEGEIWVESEEEKGSTFTFSLPLK